MNECHFINCNYYNQALLITSYVLLEILITFCTKYNFFQRNAIFDLFSLKRCIKL